MAVQGPRRPELVDEHVEGQVRVLDRVQRRLASGGAELGEGRRGPHPAAHDHRIDEESDKVLERLLVSAADLGAQDRVFNAEVADEGGDERLVEHLGRAAQASLKTAETLAQVRWNWYEDTRSPARGHRRAGRGQRELGVLRDPLQAPAPERELLRSKGSRVVDVAQELALPGGEIAVLDGQGREALAHSVTMPAIEQGQVPGEGGHGRAVRCDVVQDEKEDPPLSLGDEVGVQRQLVRKVEWDCCEAAHERVGVLRRLDHVEDGGDLFGGDDIRHRLAVDGAQSRAKDLVTPDDVEERTGQRPDIQTRSETDREGDVVRGGVGFRLPQEP